MYVKDAGNECEQTAVAMRKALTDYETRQRKYVAAEAAWTEKTRDNADKKTDIDAKYAVLAGQRFQSQEINVGCGQDCPTGYDQEWSKYCWKSANYERGCRPSPATQNARQMAEYAELEDPGPRPVEPALPNLASIVCQQCKSVMNISGSNFVANANQQMQTCLLSTTGQASQTTTPAATSQTTTPAAATPSPWKKLLARPWLLGILIGLCVLVLIIAVYVGNQSVLPFDPAGNPFDAA